LGHESDDEEVADRLRNQTYYAAALLSQSALRLELLQHRLGRWSTSSLDPWPASDKLIVSAGSRRLEATLVDLSAPMGVVSGSRPLQANLAEVGIWTPSEIWTDSVIDRFEHTLNRLGTVEDAFQLLFEAYPRFILDELHAEAYPQVLLFEGGGRVIRPDFLIRRSGSQFVDLVELKQPRFPVVVGTPERPQLSQHVGAAIAQLKDYGRWFQSSDNRRWLLKKYGLDGYEPRLTLIIGRDPRYIAPEIADVAKRGAEAQVLTYDDILRRVKGRREWLL